MSIEQGGGSKDTQHKQTAHTSSIRASSTDRELDSSNIIIPTITSATDVDQQQAPQPTEGDHLTASGSPQAPSGSQVPASAEDDTPAVTSSPPSSSAAAPTNTATATSAISTSSTTTTSTTAAAAPTASTTPRQVIAVSASKQPSAFFNLARRFLVTDESCDLSALEGAIVTAVDTAHLLERSKLAKIIRIQTSYVSVEPKRKPQRQTNTTDAVEQQQQQQVTTTTTTTPLAGSTDVQSHHAHAASTATNTQTHTQSQSQYVQHQQIQKPQRRTRTTPLRRARLIITVQRTDDYKTWLEENPHPTSGEDELDE